ncbi:MAG TPA: glycosyltransferase family 39 protein [Sedimentisphaerales bacterium]|nr:glycosyltransferase family 39 protein [Sedimentisphaerales bacterium]
MTKKAFFKLLPIFLLYFAIFLLTAEDSLDYGDEPRYAKYAENLTKGFYAPTDTLFLWNGPGYPLLLTPYAFFGVPWYWAKMLNPVFMFLAVCFIYSSIRNYMSEKTALFFSYLFGLYPPFYAELWFLLTEPFVLMLVSLFALLIIKWFGSGKYRYMLLAAVICALTILTKVFVAYVATSMLLFSLILWKWSSICRRSIPVYAVSLLLCTPYLLYTYSVTGKIFYWANSGGQVLYWLYNPHPEEFGDWKSSVAVMTQAELAHHKPLFNKLAELNFVQQDELLKKIAVRNIINNPGKMFLNWVSNLGRLWLNLPYSYKYQHPRQLVYLVPNSLLLAATLLCLYPLIRFCRQLPTPITHALGLSVVFLLGHSLVYANARYLCTIVPFIFIIIAYTATNLVKLQHPLSEE